VVSSAVHLIKITTMENTDINRNQGRSNRVFGGLILMVIGFVFFLRNLGVDVPDWLFGWNMMLIVLGVFIGVKRKFRGPGWLILIVVGSYFTLERMIDADVSRFFFPLLFTALGVYLIFSPKKHSFRRRKRMMQLDDAGNPTDGDSIDTIDSVNIFSGTHKRAFSKNLKGGDIVAVFGGCDLNLTQADFQGTITIDIVAIFGGVKIIIPPTWQIKSELTAILGGMEDKTTVMPFGAEPEKILIIRGLALFGGVDIRNF
jgi:predicted membrane protein